MKHGSETQSRVVIETASLEAYQERQLEASKPRPARDDIEARFPIPELDRMRAAKAASRAAAQTERTKETP